MKLYRRSWLVVCVPLVAVGASLTLVKSPVAVTFLFSCFGVLGMLLTLVFVAEFWECPWRGRMRLLARGAVVAGLAACSFMGFASLLGPGVFVLAATVMATSPYAMRRPHRWLGAGRWPRHLARLARGCARARPHKGVRPELDLSTLTDEQLCQLWRASYVALLNSPSDRASTTVLERQSYLDEFERRNRSGFAVWLASGPLASANPLPYLVGVPTINWDDLTREQES